MKCLSSCHVIMGTPLGRVFKIYNIFLHGFDNN